MSAPVEGKKVAPKSATGDVLVEKEPFLAVIIADSYNKSLQPCTLDRSRVLLPLANKRLIDYTLAFLSLAEIEEVILYCTSYPQLIRSHVEKSKWSTLMNIKVIVNEDARSVGDALRDLDDKQLISTDFVLLQGDLVANLDLKSCMEIHKTTRESDKDAILTRVMKNCPPGHRTRSPNTSSLYALNRSTNQILAHQIVLDSKKVKLPTELIREAKELELRYDLLDCHITLCAAMVPSLFTENFDYQTVDDLVHGVLGNQEILGNTMHVHVVEDGYAARVTDFFTYKAVSTDVLEKWAYPFSPDTEWSNEKGISLVSFGNKYAVSSKLFSKKCNLGSNVVIGDNTAIKYGASISNSVIGNNCIIGANVSIQNCYVWDNTVIEDDCSLTNTIICEQVRLYKNTQLLATSKDTMAMQNIDFVLGKGVHLGPNVTLDQPVLLTAAAMKDDWGEPFSAYESKGESGRAFNFVQPTEESSDDEEDGDDTSAEEDDSEDDAVIPDTELFYNEVLDTLQRAEKENISADNIILDINSLKHAYNIQINEVNHMVIQAVLQRPLQDISDTATSSQLLTNLKPLLKLCIHVFKNYYRSDKSQHECLLAIKEFVCDQSHDLYTPIIGQVLMFFYQNDILDEDVIVKWYETSLQPGKFKTQVSKLVEWFNEAESDSESD